MGYIGIRFVTLYAGFMPIQEVDIAVHGLVGYVITDSVYKAIEAYDPYEVYADQTIFEPHVAYGFEGCLKWHMFEVIAGWYDSEFYLEANMLINVVIF